VVVLGRRRLRVVLAAAVGAAAVAAGFAAAGFWWFTGYQRVVERYYQGIASDRPYAYWVWADIAVLAVSAGPLAGVILRRAVIVRGDRAVRLLPLAAATAIAAADLSGYSKAEVERIWLPFSVWIMAGAGLLPCDQRRIWLAVQAGTTLAVNHLVLTTW
jgi:hypothetical protein